MATIRFTEEDRDEHGFVKVAPPQQHQEPRSLADLLPQPAAAPDQTIRRSPPTKGEIASMIGMGLLLIALLGYLYVSRASAPAVSLRSPATAPATPAATVQPSGDGTVTPSPILAATPAVTGRLLIAFAAPDGQPLGAIEATRAITPTAHYGDGWIQADVQGSGLVWLRASDSPDLAIVGPDLAPRQSAPAPAAAPAARQPAVAPFVPEPTDPPPPPCAEAGVPGKMVSVCGYEDLGVLQEQAKQQWIAQYGGNVGIVATPSPQEWNR